MKPHSFNLSHFSDTFFNLTQPKPTSEIPEITFFAHAVSSVAANPFHS
jgi:hypothetical protein